MSSEIPKSNNAEIILMDTIELEEKTISDYQKLNDKCNSVITKIKVRKSKKKTKQI